MSDGAESAEYSENSEGLGSSETQIILAVAIGRDPTSWAESIYKKIPARFFARRGLGFGYVGGGSQAFVSSSGRIGIAPFLVQT